MNKLFALKVLNKLRKELAESVGYFLPLKPVLYSLSLKPRMVNFETTNICNANCVFCDYRFMERSKGIMSMEVYKKAIHDFVDVGGGMVGLTPPVGDPFLDPMLLERIGYARSFREISDIGFYTNAIALDRFPLGDILTSGISSITLSFGGFSKEAYQRIFGVNEFEHTLQNITRLANENKRLSFPVAICLSLRIERPLKDIVKNDCFRTLASLLNNIHYQYRFDNRSGRIRENDLVGIMQLKRTPTHRRSCTTFYADGPVILYNGDVAVCGCREMHGDNELILGNIMSASLIDLWWSDKLKTIRENALNGSMPRICAHCSDFNGLRLFAKFGFRKAAKENYASFLASSFARRTGYR